MVLDPCDPGVMATQNKLFPSLPEPEVKATGEAAPARARLLEAQRNQLELRAVDLEATLEAEHPARSVWALVEGMDLSSLVAEVASVEGHAGRPAIDPRVLMALWLYATIDGVGSARALARLCAHHDAYRWICASVW